MGLTCQSSGKQALRENFVASQLKSDYVVSLAGNPNTGKSTVFNALTGLKQHTGNWPGKTVLQAKGNYRHQGREITLVDLPGTYSLLANSPEEQIARDFICFADPEATVVVVDATCLERNLNLALQVMEITPKTIICLNLIDEAKRKKLHIDYKLLEHRLGVPVVPTVARSGYGLEQLKHTINMVASGALCPQPMQIRYQDALETAIESMSSQLQTALPQKLNKRWVALRLIDGDYSIIDSIRKYAECGMLQEGLV
jgi:ferrous iron transport protein B